MELKELEAELEKAKSAVKWALVSLIMLVISWLSQIVWMFLWAFNAQGAKTAFIVWLGSFTLFLYARWCARDLAPEAWKKKR